MTFTANTLADVGASDNFIAPSFLGHLRVAEAKWESVNCLD